MLNPPAISCHKDNIAQACKGKAEKVGMTTKRRCEKRMEKKDEQLFLTMGKGEKKYQFLEAPGRNRAKSNRGYLK